MHSLNKVHLNYACSGYRHCILAIIWLCMHKSTFVKFGLVFLVNVSKYRTCDFGISVYLCMYIVCTLLHILNTISHAFSCRSISVYLAKLHLTSANRHDNLWTPSNEVHHMKEGLSLTLPKPSPFCLKRWDAMYRAAFPLDTPPHQRLFSPFTKHICIIVVC